MTRSTASRRAKNSASVNTGARRLPVSRLSRLLCRFASRRVEFLPVASRSRGLRTRTTVFGGSSAVTCASGSLLRRRLRRLKVTGVSSSFSSLFCTSSTVSTSSEEVSASSPLRGRRKLIFLFLTGSSWPSSLLRGVKVRGTSAD